jgi:hypothetical protein
MSDKKQSLFDDEDEEGKILHLLNQQNTPQLRSLYRSKHRATNNQRNKSPIPTLRRRKKMSTSLK